MGIAPEQPKRLHSFGQSPASSATDSRAQGADPAPVIPDYELLRRIGRGAYGEVWLARNVTGSYVAVKVVTRGAFDHDRPFEREFEGIKRFEPISRSDPTQVAILHVGRGDGFFYYVMELADAVEIPKAEGRDPKETEGPKSETTAIGPSAFGVRPPDLSYVPHTLREDLKRHGRLPADECISIGLALTRALAHLHRCGLVHRDVKASNVIFVGGVPKLADIGLVTSVDATRSLVGTEGYVAPEGAGTPQADIYSLGKLIYEISTGCDRKEFPALPGEMVTRPDRNALLELNAIVTRACQFDPRERYANSEAMLAELELLPRGHSVKRRRALVAYWQLTKRSMLAAMLVALVGAGAILVFRGANENHEASSNPEALNCFKQAKWLFNEGTHESVLKASTLLMQAVRLDTNFVAAYYKLFECNFGMWGDELPPKQNAMENMRWFTEQLRRIDRRSAEYHTANSLVLFYDWHCDEAITEVMHALKLNRDFQRAHAFYGWYMLLSRGDVATAYREYEIAERLDASDTTIQSHRANPYYFERKFDKAIELYERANKFHTNSELTHEMLGRCYEALKQYDKAIDEYEIGARLRGRDPAKVEADYTRQRVALSQGPRAWWQANLEAAKKQPEHDNYLMGRLCTRLGDTNGAIQYLKQSLIAREQDMLCLLMDDWWDPLRSNPQFEEIVKQVGLKPRR